LTAALRNRTEQLWTRTGGAPRLACLGGGHSARARAGHHRADPLDRPMWSQPARRATAVPTALRQSLLCPQCSVRLGRGVLRAIRNIEPGDELHYFYPSTEWAMADIFDCQSGEVDCLAWGGSAARRNCRRRFSDGTCCRLTFAKPSAVVRESPFPRRGPLNSVRFDWGADCYSAVAIATDIAEYTGQ
jgi:hypothetical protein